MTPSEYVERVPTFTAVQWDGADESAVWILEQSYAGSKRLGDDLIVLDAMDRETTLPRGTWVVRDESTGGTTQVEDADFAQRFRTAG